MSYMVSSAFDSTSMLLSVSAVMSSSEAPCSAMASKTWVLA